MKDVEEGCGPVAESSVLDDFVAKKPCLEASGEESLEESDDSLNETISRMHETTQASINELSPCNFT